MTVGENCTSAIFFPCEIAIARKSCYLHAIVSYNKIPGNRKSTISVTGGS